MNIWAQIAEFFRDFFSRQKDAPIGEYTPLRLAIVAEQEALKGQKGDKFWPLFNPVFGPIKNWPWCGAFVTWCCREAGLPMPLLNPSPFGYSFALVEAWQQWAIHAKLYIDNTRTTIPEPGDIVLFDWKQTNVDAADNNWESHMGVFLRMRGDKFEVAEGNTENVSAVKLRDRVQIQGFVRIPRGYRFDEAIEAPEPAPPAGAFQLAMDFIRKWEGGWADHPLDKGGPTMYGITMARYSEYLGRPVTKEELKNIPENHVGEIYRDLYWEKVKGPYIAATAGENMALLAMNTAVNSGPGRAIQFINEITGRGAVMTWDNDAKRAFDMFVSAQGVKEMKRRFCARYYQFYAQIVRRDPSQSVFIEGWINRNNDTLRFVVN